MSVEQAKIKIIFHDIEKHNPSEAQDAMESLFEEFLTGSYEDNNGDLWEIKSASCSYSDDLFFSVDIYPDKYSSYEYFLYGDSTFKKALQQDLSFVYLSYSESGMQGDNHVNLDVWVAKDPRGTK